MPHMQEVVEDCLTSERSRSFIIPECLIKLDDGKPLPGRHWYCDVAAVDLRTRVVFLCEVTTAKRPAALHKRLSAWAANWDDVRVALQRDYGIPPTWEVVPEVFVREDCGPDILSMACATIAASGSKTRAYHHEPPPGRPVAARLARLAARGTLTVGPPAFGPP